MHARLEIGEVLLTGILEIFSQFLFTVMTSNIPMHQAQTLFGFTLRCQGCERLNPEYGA
jgi:hypothetical protein